MLCVDMSGGGKASMPFIGATNCIMSDWQVISAHASRTISVIGIVIRGTDSAFT
jgi:hypothetical protein